MRRVWAIMLLPVLLFLHVASLTRLNEENSGLSRGEEIAYIMPSSLLKITALEFRSFMADMLFLKSVNYLGSVYERSGPAGVTQQEWKWIYRLFDTTTDLDPYFLDPYYIANGYLTWNAGMVQETNALLDKGIRCRSWDWLLPFYKGFNQFYFLKDNTGASESFITAWHRPEAPAFLAITASRLAEKGKKTETALFFLEELLKRTEDVRMRMQYQTRIAFLKGALYLEQEIARYKRRFGKEPSQLDDLIAKGIIKSIPPDPLGGLYYLAPDGTIGSTSEIKIFNLQ